MEYTCSACGGRFTHSEEDEAEAVAEMIRDYGHIIPPEDRASLCDDCYAEFREWQRSQRRRNMKQQPDWPVRPPLVN